MSLFGDFKKGRLTFPSLVQLFNLILFCGNTSADSTITFNKCSFLTRCPSCGTRTGPAPPPPALGDHQPDQPEGQWREWRRSGGEARTLGHFAGLFITPEDVSPGMSLARAHESMRKKFAHARTGGIPNSRAENSCVWQGTYFIQQTARPGMRECTRVRAHTRTHTRTVQENVLQNGVTAPQLWLSGFKIERRAPLKLDWDNFYQVETFFFLLHIMSRKAAQYLLMAEESLQICCHVVFHLLQSCTLFPKTSGITYEDNCTMRNRLWASTLQLITAQLHYWVWNPVNLTVLH